MPAPTGPDNRNHLMDTAISLLAIVVFLFGLYAHSSEHSLWDIHTLLEFLDQLPIRIIISLAGGYLTWSLLTPYKKAITEISGRAVEEILTPLIGEYDPRFLPAPLQNLSPIYWPNNEEGKSKLNRTLGQQLNAIDPILFERLVAELLRLEGYQAQAEGGRQADGGVDIRARTPQGELLIVQCKRYIRDRVGGNFIRSLAATMERERAACGIFVNLRGFYPSAHSPAKASRIELWSGTKIRELLKKHLEVLPDNARRYLAEPRPKCPECKTLLAYVDDNKEVLKGEPNWTCLERDGGCGYLIAYDHPAGKPPHPHSSPTAALPESLQ
jgi:hypothetical protein